MQAAYAHAIRFKYRFYSYGDASLLFRAPQERDAGDEPWIGQREFRPLRNWTTQGAQTVKNSVTRWEAAKKLAGDLGCTLETIYLTFGQHDLVVVMDAPDDEAAARVKLKISEGGAITGTTLKAFVEADYRKIIASL